MFRNVELPTKLVLGFAVPLGIMIALALVTYTFASGVRDDARQAQIESKESFGFAITAQKMKLDIARLRQWLTDISAARGPHGLEDRLDKSEKIAQSFLSRSAQFKALYTRENDRQNLLKIEEVARAFGTCYETGKAAVKAYVDGDPDSGNKLMADFHDAADALDSRLDPFIQQHTFEGNTALVSISFSVDKLWLDVLVVSLIAVSFCSIVGWFIIRSITTPINEVIRGLTQGAEQVTSASRQLAQSSHQMAEGASEQASGLEETSSSLEEMASMTSQNAENARQANTMAVEACRATEKGRDAMAHMTQAISRIKISSDETAKIVKTIDEIAFQTNLLALNAAVEAARAGEAGKGFAVVAEEVRNLAQRSAEAAKHTASLIEESQHNAENGVRVSGEVEGIFKQIAEVVQDVTELISAVSATSDEQARGIEQVNRAVAQMDKVTQSNAANAEESASASEELSAQARELNDMVNVLAAIVGSSNGTWNGSTMTARATEQKRVPAAPVGEHENLRARVRELLHYGDGDRKCDNALAALRHKDNDVPTSAEQKVVKPEEVIPLGDEELEDF